MPRYDATLSMDIDTSEAASLIKGLGEVGQELVAVDIEYAIYQHLLELKEALIDNPPDGLPSDIDLENAISIDADGGTGTISIDTRQGLDKEDLDKPPTQEKKNVAWFLEYGRIGSEPKPFLRPLVELNQDKLAAKIANTVIIGLASKIDVMKIEAKFEREKGNIKLAQSMNGRVGGLTANLNKIRALYGENVPT